MLNTLKLYQRERGRIKLSRLFRTARLSIFKYYTYLFINDVQRKNMDLGYIYN